MSHRCTVLIAAQALLPALTDRMSMDGMEVVSFTDLEALRALATITTTRPAVVALERSFAATPRGAALINRLAADPALTGATLRIVAQDLAEPSPPPVILQTPAPTLGEPSVDATGTRRVPRFILAGAIDLTIDNTAAVLVDLSTLGAQVISTAVLRPNQRARLALSDGKSTVRATGTIAWARFEIPPGSGPRYRAGIEFVNPDMAALDGFCRMHRS